MSSILINGLGRSGTSWVHKTFDYHPNVFASFEPEHLVPGNTSIRLKNLKDMTAVNDYIELLFSCRGLRAMRKRPILRKAYRSEFAHQARVACIYGVSALTKLLPAFQNKLLHLPIPDFACLNDSIHVVKSVSELYDLPRIAREMQSLKIIYITRHPCGQVFSHVNGVKSGNMPCNYLPNRSDMARLFTFDKPAEELLESDFDQLEINAYRWAVYSDINYRTINELSNARIFRYEDICADPKGAFQDMFEWAGVEWHQNCSDFLELSLKAERGPKGYHTVIRNPQTAADKWRQQMLPEEIDTIVSICRRSAGAALYPELNQI